MKYPIIMYVIVVAKVGCQNVKRKYKPSVNKFRINHNL